MKGGLALAGILSLGILGAMIAFSHESCAQAYRIDPAGQLQKNDTGSWVPAAWRDQMPEFARAPVRPGDELSHVTTTTGWGPVEIRKSRLEITRLGSEPIILRHGHAQYWLTIAGLCALPLLVWLVVYGVRKDAPP